MPQFNTQTPFDATSESYIFSSGVGNSAPAIADDGTVYIGNGDGLYALPRQAP